MDTHKHVLQNIFDMSLIAYSLGDEGVEAIMHELPKFLCLRRHDGRSVFAVHTVPLQLKRRKWLVQMPLPFSARNSLFD